MSALQLSFEHGVVPSTFKSAYITPILQFLSTDFEYVRQMCIYN